mmetsp:Transcript_1582/g.3584  ORF Transcript_1582/g.3584 Transcript_1582/m.3584 type:complete len:218 (-) Transcript_1582:1709-2362(-)
MRGVGIVGDYQRDRLVNPRGEAPTTEYHLKQNVILDQWHKQSHHLASDEPREEPSWDHHVEQHLRHSSLFSHRGAQDTPRNNCVVEAAVHLYEALLEVRELELKRCPKRYAAVEHGGGEAEDHNPQVRGGPVPEAHAPGLHAHYSAENVVGDPDEEPLDLHRHYARALVRPHIGNVDEDTKGVVHEYDDEEEHSERYQHRLKRAAHDDTLGSAEVLP